MRKFIPKFIFSWYHFLLAYLGAAIYGWPSRQMTVIGVTGTKGKTTTCNLIAQILQEAGYKVGMATTVNFKIGEKEWINSEKQTMLGRFKLQKILKKMKKAGCQYAIVETSSEGILQHRHRGISYNIAVFTNLSPEHIERHGSFENYKKAKEKLFKVVAKKKDGIGIYNLDDQHVVAFLKYGISKKLGYGREIENKEKLKLDKKYKITDIKLSDSGLDFKMNGLEVKSNLIGQMNVYNLSAAICVAISQKISPEKISKIITKVKPPKGRMQLVDGGQKFKVVVDYAHEPESLKAAYQTVRLFNPRKIIGILGAQGGGRDRGKRSKLGEVAASYADYIFVTNEDPYDEDPWQIIQDVASGIKNKPVEKIIDRKKAIKAALKLAQEGDLVLITGKGGEVSMCVAGGQKIEWSDERVVVKYLSDNRVA